YWVVATEGPKRNTVLALCEVKRRRLGRARSAGCERAADDRRAGGREKRPPGARGVGTRFHERDEYDEQSFGSCEPELVRNVLALDAIEVEDERRAEGRCRRLKARIDIASECATGDLAGGPRGEIVGIGKIESCGGALAGVVFDPTPNPGRVAGALVGGRPGDSRVDEFVQRPSDEW